MAAFTIIALGYAATPLLIVKVIDFVQLHLRPASLPCYLQTQASSAPWAFITGSSDGIGLAFVRELVSRGCNVVLHGRNPQKLERVRTTLAAKYPKVSFHVAVIDASRSGPTLHEELEKLIEQLADDRLTVLSNNVGGAACVADSGLTHAATAQQSAAEVDRLIHLNAGFLNQVTRVLLLLLVKSHPGLIMNTGSIADRGCAWLGVYSGAKAYNMAWSSSLADEMRAEGGDVEVLSIIVGRVTRVAHNNEASGLFTPDARTMARAALQKVGCGKLVVGGYWVHDLQLKLLESLPESDASKAMTNAARKVRQDEMKRS